MPNYTMEQLETVASCLRIRRLDNELDKVADRVGIPAFKLGKLADGGYVPTHDEVRKLQMFIDAGGLSVPMQRIYGV